jgi:hypothetical protein
MQASSQTGQLSVFGQLSATPMKGRAGGCISLRPLRLFFAISAVKMFSFFSRRTTGKFFTAEYAKAQRRIDVRIHWTATPMVRNRSPEGERR